MVVVAPVVRADGAFICCGRDGTALPMISMWPRCSSDTCGHVEHDAGGFLQGVAGPSAHKRIEFQFPFKGVEICRV
jgi:hypothetical protein